MKILNTTNKELESLKEELSIENILISIRRLKERVEELETRGSYIIQEHECI